MEEAHLVIVVHLIMEVDTQVHAGIHHRHHHPTRLIQQAGRKTHRAEAEKVAGGGMVGVDVDSMSTGIHLGTGTAVVVVTGLVSGKELGLEDLQELLLRICGSAVLAQPRQPRHLHGKQRHRHSHPVPARLIAPPLKMTNMIGNEDDEVQGSIGGGLGRVLALHLLLAIKMLLDLQTRESPVVSQDHRVRHLQGCGRVGDLGRRMYDKLCSASVFGLGDVVYVCTYTRR